MECNITFSPSFVFKNMNLCFPHTNNTTSPKWHCCFSCVFLVRKHYIAWLFAIRREVKLDMMTIHVLNWIHECDITLIQTKMVASINCFHRPIQYNINNVKQMHCETNYNSVLWDIACFSWFWITQYICLVEAFYEIFKY